MSKSWVAIVVIWLFANGLIINAYKGVGKTDGHRYAYGEDLPTETKVIEDIWYKASGRRGLSIIGREADSGETMALKVYSHISGERWARALDGSQSVTVTIAFFPSVVDKGSLKVDGERVKKKLALRLVHDGDVLFDFRDPSMVARLEKRMNAEKKMWFTVAYFFNFLFLLSVFIGRKVIKKGS